MKKVLLTGAYGFVGTALRTQLISAGWSVIGTSAGQLGLTCSTDIELDIRDASAVENVVKLVRPDAVVHLAAVTHVPTSFREPQLTWHTNVLGTLNIFEAVKQHASEAFVLFVSSSEVYGESFKSGKPLAEKSSCLPMNPYAASKLAAELVCQQYFRQGHSGAIARPFNHIGPGQSPGFVTASFARQIAQIEAGLQPPTIKVGNLDAYRDFLDVSDVCDAYIKLLSQHDIPSDGRVFNIASGQATKVSAILEKMLQLTAFDIDVQLDAELLRPSDVPFAVGDSRYISDITGWKPKIPLTVTLEKLLQDWRVRIGIS